MIQTRHFKREMEMENDLSFWIRWVIANSAGETIGLGTTFLIGFGLLGSFGEGSGPLAVLLLAGAAILLGAFEGIVVGLAQGALLRQRLPAFDLRRWVMATVIGALLAWTLGMLPSTIMGMSGPPTGAAGAAAEMPDAMTYLLSMGLGALAGVVLAFAQWIALRRWVSDARLWLPANGIAWLFGMPVVFLGAGSIQPGISPLQAALLMLVAIAAAGAVVGAVHGIMLVRALLPGTKEMARV